MKTRLLHTRGFLAFAALLVAVGSVPAWGERPRSPEDVVRGRTTYEDRPNVLLILCDDLRPDALGCYGSKHVKTPKSWRVTASPKRR